MTTRVTPSSVSRSAIRSSDRLIVACDVTSCQSPPRAGRVRDPRAAHHLGLADIQGRDPFDDLLIVF